MPQKICLSSAIIDLVEQSLKRGDTERVLIVPFALVAGDWRRRDYYLFFYRGSNYTTVGSHDVHLCQSPSAKLAGRQQPEWKLEVHHDSGWRLDGVYSFFRKKCEEFFADLPSDDPKRELILMAHTEQALLADVASVTRSREFQNINVTYK